MRARYSSDSNQQHIFQGSYYVLLDFYDNLNGTSLQSLTDADKYPDLPDSTVKLTQFEFKGHGFNYGARARAFIVPPTTGNYTFYMSVDDSAELILAGTVVLEVAAKTGYRTWTESGTSGPLHLEAGQRYALDARMKNSEWNSAEKLACPFECDPYEDYFAVAWTGPGIDNITVLGPPYLSPLKEGPGTNWLLGWHNRSVGVASFEGWKTQMDPPPAPASQDWHVVVGRNSPNQAPYSAGTVWLDGQVVSNGWDGAGGAVLGINAGFTGSECSDCEVSDVMIYSRWLTDSEVDALLAFSTKEECTGPCEEGHWCPQARPPVVLSFACKSIPPFFSSLCQRQKKMQAATWCKNGDGCFIPSLPSLALLLLRALPAPLQLSAEKMHSFVPLHLDHPGLSGRAIILQVGPTKPALTR